MTLLGGSGVTPSFRSMLRHWARWCMPWVVTWVSTAPRVNEYIFPFLSQGTDLWILNSFTEESAHRVAIAMADAAYILACANLLNAALNKQLRLYRGSQELEKSVYFFKIHLVLCPINN